MNQTAFALEMFGFVFQVLGVVIVLGSSALFWKKARKKYGSLDKAYIDFVAPRIGVDSERLEKLNAKETREKLRLFPLAEWLRDNYRYSLAGSIVTLTGVVLGFWGF
jgi:hypothetical protein